MTTPAKPRPVTTPSAMTANRLRDGRVVWFAADGRWVADLAEAAIVAPETVEATLSRARRGEATQEVVGVYAVEVEATPGGVRPIRMREKLRVMGPSVPAPSHGPRPAPAAGHAR